MTKNNLESKDNSNFVISPYEYHLNSEIKEKISSNNKLKESICSDSSICRGYSDIFKLTYRINSKFNKLQEQFVLTHTQILILQELSRKDGQPLKELALATNTSKPNITGVIKTMEKKGYVERERNAEDKRSFLIKLTEKGKKMNNKIPSVDALMNNCCQNKTQDEIDILKILLKKFNDSLP